MKTPEKPNKPQATPPSPATPDQIAAAKSAAMSYGLLNNQRGGSTDTGRTLPDAVHQRPSGKWCFWDEMHTFEIGEFDSEFRCRDAYKAYLQQLARQTK